MESVMYQFEPIGIVESCYREKFGIPRQPGLAEGATGKLVFYSPYDREEMARGLEGYSHIWVIFIFHQALADGWRPTVRPPRLGGQKRVGLFASRSPHRPNPIGMSVVQLDKVVVEDGCFFLELSGIDLLDGTPVLDIKPYVPYSDALSGARGGFTAEDMPRRCVEVPPDIEAFCTLYMKETGRDLEKLIRGTLENDPRPASQRNRNREYGVLLWDVNVRWCVKGEGFLVLGCEKV